MRDFNEIKKALWLFYRPSYSYITKTFASGISEDKVHSLAELCYRYRTECSYGDDNIPRWHRSPVLYNDTESGSIIPSGLQAEINSKCQRAAEYSDVYHFKPTTDISAFNCKITYKVLRDSGEAPRLKYKYENKSTSASDEGTMQLSNSSTVGIFTADVSIKFNYYTSSDIYISFGKTYQCTSMMKPLDYVEFVSIEPGEYWEWADKKEEKVLHKFSYVVNISANPAVLKVYAKNDAIEKCSLDADKYVDTDLNKVVYTATYANGSTATIDYWSYDENEELVVYQNLNCTLGEKIQSW